MKYRVVALLFAALMLSTASIGIASAAAVPLPMYGYNLPTQLGPPANGAPASNPIYMVTPGLPKVWGQGLWNYQFTSKAAHLGTASANINGRKLTASAGVGEIVGGANANGYCELGINWYLNPHVDWDKVKDKPVLVTALVGYKLAGSGSGYAAGDVWLGTIFRHLVIESKDSNAASYSVDQPFKVVQWKTTLSALATKPGTGQLYVLAGALVTTGLVSSTQSSTQVTVYAIGLQLL